MAAPFLLDILQHLNKSVSDAFAMRYVTIISLAITSYDAFLLLPLEIQRVWRARWSVAKAVYIANRYIGFIGMGLLAHGTGGLQWGTMTDSYCRTVMGLCLVLGALSIGVANYLVLLKVWHLWGQRGWVIIVTTIAWAMSYTATIAVVVVAVLDLTPFTISTAPYGLNLCVIGAKPRILRGIWAAPIALEVVVFIITILNAMDRPRSANLSMAKALYRDGILFFVALFILRLFNLIATIVWPASLAFIGSCLIWGVNHALLHRLILNQSVPPRRPRGKTAVPPESFHPDSPAARTAGSGSSSDLDDHADEWELSFMDDDVWNTKHSIFNKEFGLGRMLARAWRDRQGTSFTSTSTGWRSNIPSRADEEYGAWPPRY